MDEILNHIEEVFMCLPEMIYYHREREKGQYPYFKILENQDISTVFGQDKQYDLNQKDLEIRIYLPFPPNCDIEEAIETNKELLKKYKKYVNTVIKLLCLYYGKDNGLKKPYLYQRPEGQSGRIIHNWYANGATENKEVVLRTRFSIQLIDQLDCCELSEVDLNCLVNRVKKKFWER